MIKIPIKYNKKERKRINTTLKESISYSVKHLMSSNLQKETLGQLITELQSKVSQLETQLKSRDEQVMCLNDRMATLKDQLQKQTQQKIQLQKLLGSKQKELFEAGGQNLAKDNILEQRQAQIQKYKLQITQLKRQIHTLKIQSLPRSSQTTLKHEHIRNENKVQFNSEQIDELHKLEKENRRLADENEELSNALKTMKNGDDLSKYSETPVFEISQDNAQNKENKQKSRNITQLGNTEQPQEAKQDKQAPKKRKLMRKPRIQVDIDTFDITPINS